MSFSDPKFNMAARTNNVFSLAEINKKNYQKKHLADLIFIIL